MSDEPASRLMAAELRDLITSGELQAGDKLPSERKLAAAHGTARNTARAAIHILEIEGLVEARHGSGVFVRPRRQMFRLAGDRYNSAHRKQGLTPFRAEVARQGGGEARVDVVGIDTIAPPDEIRELLDLRPNAKVVRRTNHYFVDDAPLQIAITFIPLATAKGTPLMTATPGPGGIYQRLEEAGYPLHRIVEEVTARMPSAAEVESLAMQRGTPLLRVLHTSLDRSGRPFEVTEFLLPADRHSARYELAVE